MLIALGVCTENFKYFNVSQNRYRLPLTAAPLPSTLLSKPSTLALKPLTISRIWRTLSNSVSRSSIWRKMSRKRAISASAAAIEDCARDDWWTVERWVCAVSYGGMSKPLLRMRGRRKCEGQRGTRLRLALFGQGCETLHD